MLRNRLPLLLLVLLAVPSHAQNSLKDKYEAFSKSAQLSYYGFRDTANKQYAEFLRSSWQRFSSSAMTPHPENRAVPAAIYVSNEDAPGIFRVPYFTATKDMGMHGPVHPIEPIAGTNEAYGKFSFKCFGMDLEVRVSDGQRYAISKLEAEDISDAWAVLSGHQYDNMLHDLLAIRDEMNLCDWAYLEIIQSFSESFLGKGDAATLLEAFIFAQSGYKMRLGMTEDKLYFLFGTDNLIYDKTYFEIDGTKYFSMDDDIPEDLFIADIPIKNEKNLSLYILKDQKFPPQTKKFRYFESQRYHVKAECYVDEGKIEFFKTYPAFQINENTLSRWSPYAYSPMDTQTGKELYRWLKFAIQGKTAAEATDTILDFIQSAFEYRQDDDVWGEDRVFFSEETLYYPYCDCEDRAILFTRLVKDMLNLDVAIVYYPNHLAAAVRLPGKPEGDCFELPSGKFTICDPTYFGAPLGKTIPGMDNSEAKILLLQ